MNEIIKSNKFKIAVAVVGVILIALVSFAAGIGAGFRKARFSYKFGENYERNFMGPRQNQNELKGIGGPMAMMREKLRDFEGHGFRNAHGLAGTIISITENNLVIKDKDNKENTIAINDKTIIKFGRDDIKVSDLKNGQQIVIMGNPGDSGVINADLIRVFSQAISQ